MKHLRLICSMMVTLLLLVAMPSVGAACGCSSFTLEQQVQRNQEVFLGQVVHYDQREIVSLDGLRRYENVVTFSIRTSYKGVADRLVEVEFPHNHSSCGIIINERANYLVFANDRAGKLSTGMCEGTTSVWSQNGMFGLVELEGHTLLPALSLFAVALGLAVWRRYRRTGKAN
ncbi:hypothetical protein CIG75_15710 [Tumebacillus algifaecis]|uniref:Tissue inhibitor of metalloproteinase n=1 Tax=Tumebacillus algifaecis TaxID=1214604 RepID=A0A223D411_9BACL|nr:hypothetical protein [Tumebacillus algifaecis]ASS76245.1 hypothetical protein CIG75_15710 [Tumebacillus algifaecis]